MTIDIQLPNGYSKQFEEGKPIVLLGANGAGKTRLSVKIEELNDTNYSKQSQRSHQGTGEFLVHRITAQKSLALSHSITIKGQESAEKEAMLGSDRHNSHKLGYKYQSGFNPATFSLNDYDKILSLFFSIDNQKNEQFHAASRKALSKSESLPEPEMSLVEKAEEIWNYLLPNRQIDLSKNAVHAKYRSERYHGMEMSDGERVVLYMIAQLLSVPPNSLVIIDEPELHIHKAILNKLWDKLEENRQDCIFMYITHDLDFAVSRSVDEVLWVKSYEGNNIWDFEFLPMSDFTDLPEGLLFEIIGTQKKILFVEGTRESLDYLIFQELYKSENYHVIPCGGCSQVIDSVKAKKSYAKFDHIEVFGIIDRDFRPQSVIERLEENDIFTLEVAEVENLFLVPGLLDLMSERLGCEAGTAEEAKSLVKKIFNGQVEKQLLSSFSNEMKNLLSNLNLGEKANPESVKSEIESKFSKENIDTIFEEKSEFFNNVDDYEEILKIFNFKELSDSISKTFGLQKGEYRKRVINFLKKPSNEQEKTKIIDSIKPYVPNLPKKQREGS